MNSKIEIKKTEIKKAEIKVITKETLLSEVIKLCPEAGALFFEAGLPCLGCGGAAFESLEEGAKAHGINDEKINELVKKVNTLMRKKC